MKPGRRSSDQTFLVGGVFHVGLLLVAQPPLLFGSEGGGATPPHAATAPRALPGLAAAALGGLCSAGFNVLTRSLSREGRPLGAVSAPLLLSHFMVATFACASALGLGATASGLAQREGWRWAALEVGGNDNRLGELQLGAATTQNLGGGARTERSSLLVGLLLLGLYCTGILLGQLAMAKGMATTRAGVGAILAVSEIAFAFLLDIALLGEPTSLLAALGSLLVFASVGALACVKARAPMPASPPRTSRGDEPLKRADAAREAWEEDDMRVLEESRRVGPIKGGTDL